MRITFLGSGGAFCDFRVNYQNNAVVDTAEGPVLLDCGETAFQSLRELGIAPESVRAVLHTHVHADHASPQTLILARYYVDDRKLPTRLVAPADVLEPLGRALVPYLDEYLDRDNVLRVGGASALVQAEARDEVEIGGVRFRFFRVPHVRGHGVDKPAYGVVLDDGATRVFWSGDTAFSPDWIARAAADSRVARIFHECSFTPPVGPPVHTQLHELQSLPEELQQRITLMHHTQVPESVELGAIAGAAARHQVYVFGRGTP